MAKQQRSRAHKESKGIHGGGGKGRPLTEVEKVLLGGGCLKAVTSKRTKRARRHLMNKGHHGPEFAEYGF